LRFLTAGLVRHRHLIDEGPRGLLCCAQESSLVRLERGRGVRNCVLEHLGDGEGLRGLGIEVEVRGVCHLIRVNIGQSS
jgi:hypothetical protein